MKICSDEECLSDFSGLFFRYLSVLWRQYTIYRIRFKQKEATKIKKNVYDMLSFFDYFAFAMTEVVIPEL